MSLDLKDWTDRIAWYTGRYYDLVGPRVLEAFLIAGASYWDIGANAGYLALTGAARVGPTGRVLAFEPNPQVREILTGNKLVNRLSWLEIVPDALSDVNGEAELTLRYEHSGTGSLRPIPDLQTSQARLRVRVRRGDEFAERLPEGGDLLVKLDVEGFEFRALNGMRRVLERPRLAVLVEVTDAWLQSTGSSAQELFALLAEAGLRAFRPRVDGWGRLRLEPLDRPAPDFQYDVLFLRQTDPRLPALVVSPAC
jgi:FkbM family methyltransferase